MATTRYYFTMGTIIYFGNDDDYKLFKSMDRHPVREVEREANRLNQQAGFVPPVDDDYTSETER